MAHTLSVILALLALTTACSREQPTATPSQTPVERGAYLATIGGCHDCHTPKVFTPAGPQLDTQRLLSGHPAGGPLPAVPAGVLTPEGWGALTNAHLTAWAGPWGVSFSMNLTPDATGLGAWTEQEFIQALRTGKHAGVGRPILPPMPWFNYAKMPDDDLQALWAFLRSLPPVANKVPEPLPPPGGAPPAPPAG
jgi:hypothetical protein